jgi:hypothetical protein
MIENSGEIYSDQVLTNKSKQEKLPSSQITKDSEEKSEIISSSLELLEKFRRRDDIALIFLKGGELGGLHHEVKEKIINHLKKWFEVTEGDVHKPDLFEIYKRWAPGLEYQFKRMKNNSRFNQELIAEKGKNLLENDRQYQFKNFWLPEAEKIDRHDPGLIRQKLMLDYFGKDGQTLMLKLKNGITRKSILKDLKLFDHNNLVKAVGEKRANINWEDSNQVSFNEFVKRIVIGETCAYKAIPGTIRKIVGDELKSGNLKKTVNFALELEKNNDKLWNVVEGDFNNPNDDKATVISTFLNAVHTVDFSENEFDLMSNSELEKFNNAL